ncbi:MAG: hypothetical protein MI920_20025 [Kiloniellales bacterium]|nr:hypothetical protein [Kiloniellales bacterium]
MLVVPVGRHLREYRLQDGARGSIIVVIGTDIPMLPHQLMRGADGDHVTPGTVTPPGRRGRAERVAPGLGVRDGRDSDEATARFVAQKAAEIGSAQVTN